MGLVDTVVDKVKDIINQGPQNWIERLGEELELTSPDGDSFSVKWRGDPRSIEKKLGIFAYPKVAGNIVQDLEVNSDMYTLTLFFDGENNDIDASRFFTACRQKGVWSVVHPVHGFIELQLISAKEENQPVESGNITEVKTEWIEPINPILLKTARELAGLLDASVDDLNVSAAQQFADKISQASDALVNGIEATSRAVNLLISAATDPLFTTIDALDNAINGIQNGFNDVVTQTSIVTDSLSGQLQQMTQLPVLGIGSTQDKMAIYSDLADDQIAILPTTVTQGEQAKLVKNQAATMELSLMAALAAAGKLIALADIQTRAQAIDLMEQIAALFDGIVGALDLLQELFESLAIDEQYFSQTESFGSAQNLVSLSTQFLLALAPDLKVERRFLLEYPRSPIEITVTEYGSLGDNDENLDLFIESNDLKGKDIVLLSAGTEVVIYG